jgi:hypothetical protein
VGTRKPDGYGFGQNFKPVMGTSFLMGVNIFHGYGFGIAKPDGFIPVAISRCATGQCPVHQETQRPTLHLREFSEALCYNSPDCPVYHRTVSGAPEESDSELASFGNPLRYNSPDMSGAHQTVR